MSENSKFSRHTITHATLADACLPLTILRRRRSEGSTRMGYIFVSVVQLIRPIDADRAAGRRALARARSQIGAPYDLLGTVGSRRQIASPCSQAYNANGG